MSKVAVVYGSKSGCTKGIAERIAEVLSHRGVEAQVMAAESATPADAYDAVIIGSGVRAGTWHASAREWVTANAESLKKRPAALFTCGLMITQGEEKRAETLAYTDALLAETGVEPVEIGIFAGWNEPKAFPLLERGIMKLMKAPQGDFRDWDAIDSWTLDTASKLGLGLASAPV